jgi:hypothetical protein
LLLEHTAVLRKLPPEDADVIKMVVAGRTDGRAATETAYLRGRAAQYRQVFHEASKDLQSIVIDELEAICYVFICTIYRYI